MFIINPDERASLPNDSIAGIDSCVVQVYERIVQLDSNFAARARNNCDRSHVESAVGRYGSVTPYHPQQFITQNDIIKCIYLNNMI